MWDTVRMDLGDSFRTKRSVWSELRDAFPYTSAELAFLIVLVGFGVAVPVRHPQRGKAGQMA